jgi:hypothetical protein
MQHAIQFDQYPAREGYLTRDETARALGVSTRTLDKHANKSAKVPPHIIWRNRAWYKATDVAAYKARMSESALTAAYDGPRPEPKAELRVVKDVNAQFATLAEQLGRVQAEMMALQAQLAKMGK